MRINESDIVSLVLECIGRIGGSMVNEALSVSKIDVYGWHLVRNEDGRANLFNDETNKFVSDVWFRWVSWPEDGYVTVCNDEGKYNVINLKGEVLLPAWHVDVLSEGRYKYWIMDDDADYHIDIRKYDK